MYEVMWNLICFLTLLGTVWNTVEIYSLRRKDKDHDTHG